MTLIDAKDAVQRAMTDCGLVGRYDVRFEGSRATGYVGKPSGNDVEVVVEIRPLGPLP